MIRLEKGQESHTEKDDWLKTHGKWKKLFSSYSYNHYLS